MSSATLTINIVSDEPVSISLDESVVAPATAAAERAGLTLEAWANAVLKRTAIIDNGLAGVREYEAEYGAFTPEERSETQKLIERLFEEQRRRPE